ncbi:hypothetical protein ACFE04_022331 [Oxalis oulophora]
MSQSNNNNNSTWQQWESATAGAVAGFATVASMHPLDIVRTRFQVNDGRVMNLPRYNNTMHAVLTIARSEGLRGLYAGFAPAVIGSSVSWGLYFYFYGRAKQRYSRNGEEKLSSGLHLASAAEAGALVCLCSNPIWLVKTRLQLQNPLHQTRPYTGFYDAFRTILREEGVAALYKGIAPGLFLVSHGAIQFTAYEELRKIIVDFKSRRKKPDPNRSDDLLNSVDYAILGGTSKVGAILLTYPFQVVRARLQQRPNIDGKPRYMDSWHVLKETARFEGIRGFYKGITPNLLKNVPASAITFIVYENISQLEIWSGSNFSWTVATSLLIRSGKMQVFGRSLFPCYFLDVILNLVTNYGDPFQPYTWFLDLPNYLWDYVRIIVVTFLFHFREKCNKSYVLIVDGVTTELVPTWYWIWKVCWVLGSVVEYCGKGCRKVRLS